MTETAKALAATRGVSYEEIAVQTTENFFRLFNKVPRTFGRRRMSYAVTILGCGFSGGVPRPVPDGALAIRKIRKIAAGAAPSWSSVTHPMAAAPASWWTPRPTCANNCSMPVWTGSTACCSSHEHADHIHGIDDLRAFFIAHHRRLDVYVDEPTWRVLLQRFGYCFITPPGSSYPPFLNHLPLTAGEAVTISGAGGIRNRHADILHHGDITALGFRFGTMAYSPDVVDIRRSKRRGVARYRFVDR